MRVSVIFFHFHAQNAHVLSSPTAIPSNACAGKKGKGFANRPPLISPISPPSRVPKTANGGVFCRGEPAIQCPTLPQRPDTPPPRPSRSASPFLVIPLPCAFNIPSCTLLRLLATRIPKKPLKKPPSQRLSPHRTRCVPPPRKNTLVRLPTKASRSPSLF